MQNFLKIADRVDVLPLQLALQRQPELFGRRGQRQYVPNSPHVGMTDIWVRYNDCRPFEQSGSWSKFNDPHDAVWYPESAAIPEVRPLVFDLMARVQGERLGGVLITKLPPGGRIESHVDSGWHAGYYDKYYVAVKAPSKSYFGFPDGQIDGRDGDVYWFRNDVPHWVVNDSDDERISMIVCIKHTKGPAW
jgi:quercetin dioxygenase-like cupin family protein